MDAFEELLTARSKNNNKLKRGEMKALIESFHKIKLYCVTKQNLEYIYKLYLHGKPGLLSNNSRTTVVPTTAVPTTAVVEEPPVRYVEYDDITSITNNGTEISSLESSGESNKVTNKLVNGRQKGLTQAAINQSKCNSQLATTLVATFKKRQNH
jgi:hypothetical protein